MARSLDGAPNLCESSLRRSPAAWHSGGREGHSTSIVKSCVCMEGMQLDHLACTYGCPPLHGAFLATSYSFMV